MPPPPHPQRTFGTIWRHLWPLYCDGEVTGIWWIEPRDADKHLTLHTEHPLMMKNYWAPNVNSAEVDKFCLKCSLSRELKSRALWQYRGMGVRFIREGTYVYLCLIHVHVWQKTAQRCKAINLQLKWSKFKLKKKKLFPKFPRCWVKLTTELDHQVNEFGESFLPFPNLGSFSRQLLNKLLKMSSFKEC